MFRRYFRKIYDTFISLKGPAELIARSFAAGVFVGCCPFIGIHTGVCFVVVPVFRLNFTAMYLATWIVCNPLTAVPLLVMEYEVGRRLLQWPVVHWPKEGLNLRVLLEFGWDAIGPLSAGWLIVGGVMALASYFMALRVARRIRARAETAPRDESSLR